MSPRLFFALILRQSLGARTQHAFLIVCIAVGVCAVVGVSGLVAVLEEDIRARSRELLGGDLAVESRRELPDADKLLPRPYQGLRRAELTNLRTMARLPDGSSRLVELKAVNLSSADYPLVGDLELVPRGSLRAALDDHTLLVARELMHEQKLAPGAVVRIGKASFRVAGIVAREPDVLMSSLALGPRVLMTSGGLARTGLTGFGSRIVHRVMFTFPDGVERAEIERLKELLTQQIPGGGSYVRIETELEAQPALRDLLIRVRSYLSLVALLSILVGGASVFMVVTTWVKQSATETAVMRCLGLRPRDILALYTARLIVFAVLGSVLGAALGVLLVALTIHVRPDFAPAALEPRVFLGPIVRGVSLGTFVSLIFGGPALLGIWTIPPALVLRSDAEPVPLPPRARLLMTLATLLTLFGVAFVQTDQLSLAALFTAGVLVLASLLFVGAKGLFEAVRHLPRERLSPFFWHGASALTRPGAGALGSIVAVGMGTLVVASISFAQSMLQEELASAIPDGAASVFLLDVQPEQWLDVQSLAKELGATALESAPIVMTRLTAVDGKPITELAHERESQSEGGREQWALTREQRMTSMAKLPEDNRLVAGNLWSRPNARELSVEQDFARRIGAKLGSILRFDIQGIPMEFEVTSLRSVRWRSFALNFFLVAEPGSLDGAPSFLMAGVQIAPALEDRLQDALVEHYPTLTVLRARELLTRVAIMLEQAAVGVTALGMFAALGGLLTLAAAILSSQMRRAREAALLKTLGLTRLRVAALFAWEYGLSGGVAGGLGASGAYLCAVAFAAFVLDQPAAPPWPAVPAVTLAASLLSVVFGLLASARALAVPPMTVFRDP